MTIFRNTLILTATALLSACGFTPLHAPDGVSSSVFSTINTELAPGIAVQDKEAAFWVQNALKDRLGNGQNMQTILRLKPQAQRAGIGISGDDIATRYDLGLNVGYELIDAKSGKVLNRGTVRSVSTFSASTDPYALTASEKATTRDLAKDSADRIIAKIASYYAQKSQ